MPDPDVDAQSDTDVNSHHEGDLTDLLSELRILLPGTQTLMAFLIILPFNSRFTEIQDDEKWIYVLTFVCAVMSLVCFTTPAVHHRLQRPLRDREAFKIRATRWIIAGLVPLSIAVVLVTQLVLSTVIVERWFSWAVSSVIAVLILVVWWIVPISMRKHTTDRERVEHQANHHQP